MRQVIPPTYLCYRKGLPGLRNLGFWIDDDENGVWNPAATVNRRNAMSPTPSWTTETHPAAIPFLWRPVPLRHARTCTHAATIVRPSRSSTRGYGHEPLCLPTSLAIPRQQIRQAYR